MNPSASGWIAKHLPYFLKETLPQLGDDVNAYFLFRESGFIYGSAIKTLSDSESKHLNWTEEECTKVNLLDALIVTYFENIENPNVDDLIDSIISFYQEIDKRSDGLLAGILGKGSPQNQLEAILTKRIQTNTTLLKKNFSHLITNALLYIDVLAFDHYLVTQQNPHTYAAELETVITNIIWISLQGSDTQNNYSELLHKLFEQSIRYNTSLSSSIKSLENIPWHILDLPLEQQYTLDLLCLATWGDQKNSTNHAVFIVSEKLNIAAITRENALLFVQQFINTHKEKIPFLNYSNPAKHFYNQTSRTVSTLILRNQKRLLKELEQSKDLVRLLGASTVRGLDHEERTLVKRQLLDICKAVPSLAIFILPGGGLLLPLLIKFIPKLLPSAFNENYEE